MHAHRRLDGIGGGPEAAQSIALAQQQPLIRIRIKIIRGVEPAREVDDAAPAVRVGDHARDLGGPRPRPTSPAGCRRPGPSGSSATTRTAGPLKVTLLAPT